MYNLASFSVGAMPPKSKKAKWRAETPDEPRDSQSNASAGQKRLRMRRWCFTLHVDAIDSPFSIAAMSPEDRASSIKQIRYLVAQLEISPTTQKYHWQGFVMLQRQCDLQFVKKKVLGSLSVHLEPCNGSIAQNIAYCTKDESRVPGVDRYEVGTRPADADDGQGSTSKRSQYDVVMDKIQQGVPLDELVEQHGGVVLRYGGCVTKAIAQVQKKEKGFRRPVYVEVRWGPPGTGKTTSVMASDYAKEACNRFDPPLHCWNSKKIFIKRPGMAKWFDGYEGQKVLLLDDWVFVEGDLASWLLEILDVTVTFVPVKGGSAVTSWEHVVITTNVHPTEWFVDPVRGTGTVTPMIKAAVLDRIHRVEEFTGASYRQLPQNIPLPYPMEDSEDEEDPTTPVLQPAPEAGIVDIPPASQLELASPASTDSSLVDFLLNYHFNEEESDEEV